MTRRRLSRGLLALLALLSSPSLADDAPDPCALQRKELQRALESLDRFETLVPHVPPDEAVYIEKEEKASLSAGSEARLSALMERPFYYPHQLHSAFENARAKLEDIEALPRDASLERRIEVTAQAPSYLCAAKKAWDDYVRMDNGKNLQSQQVFAAAFRLKLAISAPGDFISCLAQRLALDAALAGGRR